MRRKIFRFIGLLFAILFVINVHAVVTENGICYDIRSVDDKYETFYATVVSIDTNQHQPWKDSCYVIIPETIQDGKVPVTAISVGAFNSIGDKLLGIKIPNSIEDIDHDVFYYCTNLPVDEYGVRYADTYLIGFVGNYSTDDTIVNYTIKEGTRFIGNGAFYLHEKLQKVTIPESVISIKEYAFSSTGITELTIPENVMFVGYHAFAYCKNLNKVSIKADVKEFNNTAFDCCNSLPVENKLRYADTYLVGVEDIVGDIFDLNKEDFDNSDTYIIKEGTKWMSYLSFYGHESLTHITIPSSVKYISGFGGCKGLKSIEIPNSAGTIGWDAFANSGLTEIVIPNSVKKIEGSAFYGCNDLENVQMGDSVITIEMQAFYLCGKLKSIDFPNALTDIGDMAFMDCTELSELNIPSSVKYIGERAFQGCKGLKKIVFNGGHDFSTQIGSYAFSDLMIDNMDGSNPYVNLDTIICKNSMPGLDFNNFCWGAGRKDDPYGVYDSTVLVIPCGEDITKHDGWKEFNKVYNDCSENYYSDNVKANSAEIYFNHEVLAKKNETDDVSLNVYFVVKGADLDTTIEATAKNDEGLYFAELTSLKPNTTYSFGAYGSMSLDTGDGEVYTETFYYYNKESEVLPASFTTLDKSSLSNAEQTNTFTIYPNPAKEVITLDLGQLILDGADAVVIFNSNGQVVYKSNIKNPISNIKISDFESGVYYVKVRSEVKKLIVE